MPLNPGRSSGLLTARPRLRLFLGAAAFWLGTVTLLRLVLYFVFAPPPARSVLHLARALEVGLRLDLAAASWLFLPAALWLTLLPRKAYAGAANRAFMRVAFGLWASCHWFLLAAEYFFFEEFQSRFNNVAVDYLIYPHEVFVNIWDSYPVIPFVLLCAALGWATFWAMRRLFPAEDRPGAAARPRWLAFGCYAAFMVLATQTVSYQSSRFGTDRVLREISLDGAYAFVYAAWSRDLDYRSFYRTLPEEEAFARTRALLREKDAVWGDGERDLLRRFPAKAPWPGTKKNVIFVLVESFGSEFMGALGADPSWTPRMDALSKEGILFTHLYATGNRTVRGFEGALSSFPPLPGDSIVKRHLSKNVSTIGRTLRALGYHTLFVYGGVALFDGMRAFTLDNGFERTVEEGDFDHPVHKTIWGVSDEDILNRAIEESRAMSESGKPFLTFILTVSNHKPYTFPEGRIPENPDLGSRQYAVKYCDWALGDFMEKLKREPFYKDSVVSILADHGARVYGSPAIPIHSYEIPWLIFGGGIRPRRVDTLGSQLDVTPTILSMIGAPYASTAFGRDILAVEPEDAWAVMNHNRDVGMLRRGRMVTLGLRKSVEYWKLEPGTRALLPAEAAPEHETLLRDAEALFQTGDALYRERRFNIPDAAALER